MTKNIIKVTGLAAFLLASGAYATSEGFYLGGQLARTNVYNTQETLQTGTISPSTNLATFGPSITVNPSNTGYGGRFFVGYNLNTYFGMEMGFAHYGASTYKVGSPSPQLISGNPVSNPTVRTNAFDFVGKGTVPIGVIGAFGKFGVAIARQSSSGSLMTTYSNSQQQFVTTSGTSSTARPTAAVGVSWDITPNWVTDLSVSRIFGGSGFQSADMYALGISYHFVDKYCGQFLC